MAPKHPYYPLNAKIVGYHPMVLSMGYVLAVFGGSMALVAILTWYLSGAYLDLLSYPKNPVACYDHFNQFEI